MRSTYVLVTSDDNLHLVISTLSAPHLVSSRQVGECQPLKHVWEESDLHIPAHASPVRQAEGALCSRQGERAQPPNSFRKSSEKVLRRFWLGCKMDIWLGCKMDISSPTDALFPISGPPS